MRSPRSGGQQGSLRSEMGLLVLIFMMVGLNVGGGLFTLTAVAAGLTGPSLFVAQIISALPILLAIVPYVVLTRSAPRTAASYQYAKAFSYPLAVSAVLVLLVAMPLGGLPLFAITNAKYFMMLIPGAPEMVPGLPLSWVQVVAIATVLLFYLINLVGIKPSAYIEFVMTAILLLALGLFIALGLPALRFGNFKPLFTGGALGLAAAAALSYTLLAGGLFGIELGDEVKHAHSTIPKALVISISIVLVLYILIDLAAVGVGDVRAFAKGNLSTPAREFLPGALWDFFVIGGGIMACVTTVHAVMTISGRYAMKFAEDGFFPSFVKRVNTRFCTPHWGLTIPFVLSVLTILFVQNLIVLGAMLNFGLLFMVSMVLMCAFRLPRSHPEIFTKPGNKFSPAVVRSTALIATLLNIVFMALLVVIIFQQKMPWAFWLFIIAIAAGLVLYYARARLGHIRRSDTWSVEQSG
jgi:APA family basic amino acid/polyamine antiporter